jgi:hypothetical protein
MRAITPLIASIPWNGSFEPVRTRSITPLTPPWSFRSIRTMKLLRRTATRRG